MKTKNESVKELEVGIANVNNQRRLLYNFITWYNAKPKVEKSKEGLVATGVIDEFLKL